MSQWWLGGVFRSGLGVIRRPVELWIFGAVAERGHFRSPLRKPSDDVGRRWPLWSTRTDHLNGGKEGAKRSNFRFGADLFSKAVNDPRWKRSKTSMAPLYD